MKAGELQRTYVFVMVFAWSRDRDLSSLAPSRALYHSFLHFIRVSRNLMTRALSRSDAGRELGSIWLRIVSQKERNRYLEVAKCERRSACKVEGRMASLY